MNFRMFDEVIHQRRLSMPNLHQGDQRRHNAALRSGLTAETKGRFRDALVDHVLEEPDVGAEGPVVEARIHLLGNPPQHTDLLPNGAGNIG